MTAYLFEIKANLSKLKTLFDIFIRIANTNFKGYVDPAVFLAENRM